MAKRGRAIRASVPTLLPKAVERWYRPPVLGPRGRRDRHERLLPNDVCPCGSGKKFKRCHRGAPAQEMVGLTTAATLDYTMAAARPLLIETHSKHWPLITSGTCLLITFRDDLWILSTGHAFKNQGLTPDRARVPRSIAGGSLNVLRTTGLYVWPTDTGQDTAWLDFVLIQSSDRAPRWWRLPAFDAMGFADLGAAQRDDWLRVFGFAKKMGNEVDYDARRVIVGGCSLDGCYLGPTESKYVHAVEFEDTGHIDDFNGMSGGPVFFAKRGSEAWEFAGILITQSSTRRLVRLIDARAVRDTLESFYARRG